MGDLVHVLIAAFQSNNSSEKDRSHKLEMYPVWPNRGLLMADYALVLTIDCGGKFTKINRRGHT
jgi:hypothetical protein